MAVEPYRLLGEPLSHFLFISHSPKSCDDDICYLFSWRQNYFVNTKIAEVIFFLFFLKGWWEASSSVECRIFLLRFVPFYLWFLLFVVNLLVCELLIRNIFTLTLWFLKQSYSEGFHSILNFLFFILVHGWRFNSVISWSTKICSEDHENIWILTSAFDLSSSERLALRFSFFGGEYFFLVMILTLISLRSELKQWRRSRIWIFFCQDECIFFLF